MKQIYKIDEHGYLVFGAYETIAINKEIPEGYTDILLPRNEKGDQLPFYRPKLVDGMWIEDMAQEEIEALNNQPKPKTKLETLQEAVDMLVLDTLGVL